MGKITFEDTLIDTEVTLLIKYDTRLLLLNQSKMISLTEIKNMKKQRMVLNGPLPLWSNIAASVPQ